MKYIDELIGQSAEGVVVSWVRNSVNQYSGFIRIKGYGGNGSKSGLWFEEKDVLSAIEPVEIKPGMAVYCLIGPPTPGQKYLVAKDIDFIKQ